MQLSASQKETIRHFFSTKPVKRAFLFGSQARNEAGRDSDIDILVELDYTHPIGMRFFSYQDELGQLLNAKVDVLSSEGLSRHVRPYIDADKILIYERKAA